MDPRSGIRAMAPKAGGGGAGNGVGKGQRSHRGTGAPGSRKERASKWKCKWCPGFVNFADRMSCFNCHMPKSVAFCGKVGNGGDAPSVRAPPRSAGGGAGGAGGGGGAAGGTQGAIPPWELEKLKGQLAQAKQETDKWKAAAQAAGAAGGTGSDDPMGAAAGDVEAGTSKQKQLAKLDKRIRDMEKWLADDPGDELFAQPLERDRAERDKLRGELQQAKPLGVRLQTIATSIEKLKGSISKAQEGAEAKREQARVALAAAGELDAKVAKQQAELLELEAQHRDLLATPPSPPAQEGEEAKPTVAAQIRSLDLLLGSLGAEQPLRQQAAQLVESLQAVEANQAQQAQQEAAAAAARAAAEAATAEAQRAATQTGGLAGPGEADGRAAPAAAGAGDEMRLDAEAPVDLADVASLREYLQKMGVPVDQQGDEEVKAAAKRCLDATAEIRAKRLCQRVRGAGEAGA